LECGRFRNRHDRSSESSSATHARQFGQGWHRRNPSDDLYIDASAHPVEAGRHRPSPQWSAPRSDQLPCRAHFASVIADEVEQFGQYGFGCPQWKAELPESIRAAPMPAVGAIQYAKIAPVSIIASPPIATLQPAPDALAYAFGAFWIVP